MLNAHNLLTSLIEIEKLSNDKRNLDLLSPRGKILSAIVQYGALAVKEIPHLSGVSFRTCFEQLRYLEDAGVVEKSVDPNDRRRHIIKLKIDNETFIKNKFSKFSNIEYKITYLNK